MTLNYLPVGMGILVPDIKHPWRFPIAVVLLILCTDAGCSRPLQTADEVNWGQPKPKIIRRTLPPERPEEMANGENADRQAKAEGGGNAGPERSEATGGSGGIVGESSVDSPTTGSAGQARGVGDKGPGGASDTQQDSSPDQPQPALPGREPIKPTLTAAEAADSAKELLRRAQQHLRAGNASAAAEAAIEAYDNVLPHVENDAECRKLCRQLDEVLTSAGRRSGRPTAVPTRFE